MGHNLEKPYNSSNARPVINPVNIRFSAAIRDVSMFGPRLSLASTGSSGLLSGFSRRKETQRGEGVLPRKPSTSNAFQRFSDTCLSEVILLTQVDPCLFKLLRHTYS